jgi:hypothetical protein
MSLVLAGLVLLGALFAGAGEVGDRDRTRRTQHALPANGQKSFAPGATASVLGQCRLG